MSGPKLRRNIFFWWVVCQPNRAFSYSVYRLQKKTKKNKNTSMYILKDRLTTGDIRSFCFFIRSGARAIWRDNKQPYIHRNYNTLVYYLHTKRFPDLTYTDHDTCIIYITIHDPAVYAYLQSPMFQLSEMARQSENTKGARALIPPVITVPRATAFRRKTRPAVVINGV